MARLQLTQDPASDDLFLSEDPFALLTGMLLDQQIPMETAFAGPRKIVERIGGIDPPRLVADYDPPEQFTEKFSTTPAVHRFPGSMAKRVQDLAREIVDRYDGDAAQLWLDGNPDGAEVLRRLKPCPVSVSRRPRSSWPCWASSTASPPKGWREAAGDYGKAGTHMSIADVVDKGGSLEEVRAYKKKMKAAAAKAKAG